MAMVTEVEMDGAISKVSEGGWREESKYSRIGNPKQALPQISQLPHRVNPTVESMHYSEKGVYY